LLSWAVAILLLSWTTYFAGLNSTAYDFTLRLAGPVPVQTPAVIVAIDEDSLHRIGRWPWTRDKLAAIIERIETAKPLAIAVDVLLDDKSTPRRMRRSLQPLRRPIRSFSRRGLDSTNGIDQWLEPNPRFLQKHVRLGHVHTDHDFDDINRRILSAKPPAAAA
jgi:CHASE2 domain-containing sensor protein